jgi:hypothetical protein
MFVFRLLLDVLCKRDYTEAVSGVAPIGAQSRRKVTFAHFNLIRLRALKDGYIIGVTNVPYKLPKIPELAKFHVPVFPSPASKETHC